MKRAVLFIIVVIGLMMVPSLSFATSHNVALNATAELNGAPFFTNGWGSGQVVGADTVVDGTFVPRGNQWDQGPVWWDSHDDEDRWIKLDLGCVYVIDSLIIQADDNDAYKLQYWDLDTNTWQLAWDVPNYDAFGWGMQTRPNPADDTEKYVLPAPIVTNALRFEGNLSDGDKFFSVSEIQAFGELDYCKRVLIDIKPGSDPNSIQPSDRGMIPVAILTTGDFDATAVDADTVRFGPNEAAKAHQNAHIKDVDGDGDLDMVLHFWTLDTGIAPGDTEATLTGQTVNGIAIKGTDAVNTVPPQ